MSPTTAERITTFENRFALAQATEVVDLTWGYAVLQADFPHSHYHNRIVVTTEVSSAEVLGAADEILGGLGLQHRYVSTESHAVGQGLTGDFAIAGYDHETIVAMAYSGPEVEPPVHDVQTVSFEVVRPAIIRDWRVMNPTASDEELGQLADRTVLSGRGAELIRLAVFEGDEIAAHADLYVDAGEHLAQFENLVTHGDFRGRGYGDALVRYSLRRAAQAGCDLCCLTAGLNDWPYEWYRRFGYVDAGRTHHFSRR